ncbi:MAG: polyphenol oxidase family protein, partial [Anaerolineales bacterium]
MLRIETNTIGIYQFDMWAATPLTHGVFSRQGGISQAPYTGLNLGGTVGDVPDAVAENHRRAYASLGLDAARACTVWQVHGADTVIANGPTPNRKWINRADGMVTNQPGVPLMMRFADCVPLLFFDPVQHVIGIAHAGWRGTLNGAQTSVIETMQSAFGSQPADIQVGIGPSIGPDDYQVGEEVVAQVRESFGSTDGLIQRATDGSAYLDL